ncbi:MAG: response regulator [Rhodospirillaceae bacterium]|nr:response regulator [Rhodospirillales bacterium]MBT3905423.1 response regulator [Rhodospirillaceae bacterium]MBT4700287.1 response regulator [Rhodospirillaceae bacterium]MBT5034147.1 response regulator [Rhodospirillaceae bacterium]MBT6220859.1 response regulator [Rhodospirillaceae bacterium]
MSTIDLVKLRILVIDDEPFMRQLIIRVLNDLGIKDVVEAEDGHKGITAILQSRRRLDIIICDLEMPEFNGFQFVQKLRTLPKIEHRDIPVLVVTGHSDEAHVQDAVNAGINGFLVKPVSKQALESRLVLALNSPQIDPDRLKQF